MNKLEYNNIADMLNMICKRPKMYFENPTINNMFRFLDGYYMSEVIHTPEEERIKCEKREELFWNSFYKFLANKYNKEIVNKQNIPSQNRENPLLWLLDKIIKFIVKLFRRKK